MVLWNPLFFLLFPDLSFFLFARVEERVSFFTVSQVCYPGIHNCNGLEGGYHEKEHNYENY